MTGSEQWTWEFRSPAADSFDALDTETQQRIVRKLDEIVDDSWREPYEHIEPLSGMPHGKIRVGEFRLGAAANRQTNTLTIYDIEHRSGAYKPGDD